jgi:hypothetical protein
MAVESSGFRGTDAVISDIGAAILLVDNEKESRVEDLKQQGAERRDAVSSPKMEGSHCGLDLGEAATLNKIGISLIGPQECTLVPTTRFSPIRYRTAAAPML